MLTNHESRFLEENATEAVSRAYVETAQTICDGHLSAAPRSSWHVLDETENHILVETPGGLAHSDSDQIPFHTTRLHLDRCDGAWKIRAILEPCSGCNWISELVAGQCFHCNGTGEPLRPEDEHCKRCNGTGRCVDCIEEEVTGWRTATCLKRQ